MWALLKGIKGTRIFYCCVVSVMYGTTVFFFHPCIADSLWKLLGKIKEAGRRWGREGSWVMSNQSNSSIRCLCDGIELLFVRHRTLKRVKQMSNVTECLIRSKVSVLLINVALCTRYPFKVIFLICINHSFTSNERLQSRSLFYLSSAFSSSRQTRRECCSSLNLSVLKQ